MEDMDVPNDKIQEDVQPKEPKRQKSKTIAYLLWLFGGFFGAHHLYLRRDSQAFIYISTIGGYMGIGWLRDIYRIPAYVADVNEDPTFVEEFKRKLRLHRQPPFSTVRFTTELAVAYFWAELYLSAIPQDEVYGINFKHLIILTPFIIALGVWTVGNIGRERGSIWIPLIAAYACYPSLYYIGEDSTWICIMVIASSYFFDTYAKQWRLKPRKRKGLIRRFVVFSAALALFFSLLGSYFYFNAIVTDSEGEEIKLSEAIQYFFTSPIWQDFKASLEATWNQAKNQGFWATWRQLVDLSDPRGEINAYRVLGLSQTASQTEVTARWRQLSRDNHPDKVKGSEEERREAQEKFMEIQQAYEILSSAKNRRQRRNRRPG